MKKLIVHPKALIVDDDLIILDILNTAVDITGIFDKVVRATNCKDATSALAKETFGLIILDHHLPDGKGHELLHNLRHNPADKNCNVPTIFTTGAIGPHLERELQNLPLVRFMPKPYVMENVVELILDILSLR